MFASIIGFLLSNVLPGLVGKIADDVLQGAFTLIGGEITRRENIAQGVAQQAATETAASLKTETAIAAAETAGPSNAAEAVKRAQEGTI